MGMRVDTRNVTQPRPGAAACHFGKSEIGFGPDEPYNSIDAMDLFLAWMLC